MNSLMRSIGRADSPTPPNKTNKNHPINAMNPIQNTGNEVGIDTIVEDLDWLLGELAAFPKGIESVVTGILAVLRNV